MNCKGVCRTCLRSGGTMCSLFDSIFFTEFNSSQIAIVDLLERFTKIQISYDDGFPDQICTNCVDDIQRSYYFKLKCKRSETTLRQLKDAKIHLKKLKDFPIKGVYNSDSQDRSRPNILPIKREKVEFHETNEYADKEQLIISIEEQCAIDAGSQCTIKYNDFVKDDQLVHNRSSIQGLTHVRCVNNFIIKTDSPIQHVKQEPELDISIEARKFDEIDFEEKSNIENVEYTDGPYVMFEIEENRAVHIDDEDKLWKFDDEEIQYTPDQIDSGLAASDQVRKDEFKCSVCSKLFPASAKYRYQAHIKNHTVIRPYKCEICLKKFRHKNNLKDHMQVKHAGESIKNHLHCEICAKIFRRKDSLIRHLNNHSEYHAIRKHVESVDIKIVQCNVCYNFFPSNADLIRHSRSHTKEQPFKCEFCSKSFRYSTNLRAHLRSIHAFDVNTNIGANIEQFNCKICSKTFRYKRCLGKHMKRKHEPTTHQNKIQCKICSNTAKDKNRLRIHMSVRHAGESSK